MADINNFRQLDFQESGEPADNDRVLIVEIDNDKVVGAKNYALAKLKGYISADALAYLEECRLINTSVSEKEERVSNIASQSAELLEATVGETIDTIEQTVISTESGGINEFSVIQKNGTKHILQVRNGKQGDQGVPGGPGPAVPLVQTTGQSTTEAMSQKAVSDSLDSLKSDLDSKIKYSDSLTYEEIMAKTDLSGKVASASVIKDYDSKRYIDKYYSDSEVNNFGGFQNTVKDFIKNYIQNGLSYYGWVQINSRYAFIGQKYYDNYGAFLLIGFEFLHYVQLNNGVFNFRIL